MVAKMMERVAALADPQNTEPATYTVLIRLREMIVTGQIAPGTRLRAEGLAAQLDVSRTPIRSALAVLSAEGLVLYNMNRGYTVRAVTLGDIYDSLEVRSTIEGLACRLSIEQGWADKDLDRLAEILALARGIVDRGEWSEALEHEWYEYNWIFHRSIHHAARNLVLRHSMRMTILYPIFGDPVRVSPTVAAHVPPRAQQISATPPPHIVQSQADHEALLAAIRAGDSAQAERVMSEHVLRTKARILAIATVR